MKTIKILSNLFLILNIYFAFSFINEFYNLHITLFDLSYFMKISDWWTLIIFPIINFIIYLVFIIIILVFLKKIIKNVFSLKIILFINLILSFMLFALSILIINHASDVKLFKDFL